jgi:ATP-dependent DNA helicase DinG
LARGRSSRCSSAQVLKELPITIITQKRGDAVGPLVERFAKDETSILLGTMSLWQGVDVPGNSCILVAIDRIPFPRPDEPVMSARASLADAAGGSGFMQVSLAACSAAYWRRALVV